jgi:hypothetical protein
MVAHVCIDYATPAVAAGSLGGPRASTSLVEMVTDRLPVVSRPLGLGRVAAAREAGADPPPSAAASAAAVVAVTISPAGTTLAVLLLIASLPVESRPPVQHIRPPLLGLPHHRGGSLANALLAFSRKNTSMKSVTNLRNNVIYLNYCSSFLIVVNLNQGFNPHL